MKTYSFYLIKNSSKSNWSQHDAGIPDCQAESALDAIAQNSTAATEDIQSIDNWASAYVELSDDRELWAEPVEDEEKYQSLPEALTGKYGASLNNASPETILWAAEMISRLHGKEFAKKELSKANRLREAMGKVPAYAPWGHELF